ncbi:MAG TPA: hypothetical protein VFR21_05665 [Bradyrhizobium sp.]|jgi:hypothetical protein|nr:hypothetical protein [Bradyrhizobium sp.]
MSAYRIKQLGAHVVVGTEDEAVLICKTLDIARQAVADAEGAQAIPTWQLLSQRAARIGDEAKRALTAGIAARLIAARDDDGDVN